MRARGAIGAGGVLPNTPGRGVRARGGGFTLVEMAIVCVIMAVLAGILVPMVFNLLDRDKLAGAKLEVQAAKDHLIGYFVSPPAQDKGAPNADQVFLPAAAHIAGQLDAWNRPLIYVSAAELAKSNLTRSAFCRLRVTSLSVRTRDGVIANVAFVVGSHGKRQDADVDFAAVPVDVSGDTDDIVEWVTLAELTRLACSR
ncbi:MAG: type II secretion system protein [Desulfovibrionaceae bacterium]